MTIKIEVINTPQGSVVVLPSKSRIATTVRTLREQAAKEEEPEKATILAQADEIEQGDRDIRERFGSAIEVREFESEPYTYGQKLEAERESTTWESGQPRLDGRMMDVRLIAASLGKTVADVLGMRPPTIVAALAREVVDISEPDPGKLDFFFTSPISSGEIQTLA